MNVGKSPRDLLMRVAPAGTAVALVGDRATLDEKDGYTLLRIPAAATPVALKLLLSDGDADALQALREDLAAAGLAWSRSRRAARGAGRRC